MTPAPAPPLLAAGSSSDPPHRHPVFTPASSRSTIQDGHLYGSLIDILRVGAPLMIVASGMTMVIATGGIDISVGAVVAISGAVAAC